VKLLPKNPIRWMAVICVAITSAYVMWLGNKINDTLSGPGWCATALGAGKASAQDGSTVKGLEACVGLLTIQLKSLSTNSHILLGTIALCLLVLVVIVIASGKLDLELPTTLGGGGVHVSREATAAAQAATSTAAAAVARAGQIAEEADHVPVPSSAPAQAGSAPAVHSGESGSGGGVADDRGTAHPDLGSG